MEQGRSGGGRGHCGDDYVYDLEVGVNHNYIADGVLVSNCHYLKNTKALRTKAALALAKTPSVKSVVCLSGTPLLNRPVEFFSTLNLLRPGTFNNWWKFTNRYCDAVEHRFGRDVSGASNVEELSSLLRDAMVRRTKDQVLKDLPSKTRTKTWIKPSAQERRAYHRAIDDAIVKDAETETEKKDLRANAIALQMITAARQAAGNIKVKHAIKWISEYQDQGLPVLVFAHHKSVLTEIQDACHKAGFATGRIDGSVSQSNRTSLVAKFQAGDLDVMVLSSKAAGVGITLTRASNVLFVERQWTPGEEEQAEDRVHRIGQDSAVTVRYLLAEGTVDDEMDELLEEKRGILHSILDGDGGSTTESLSIQGDMVKRWAEKVKQ